MSRVVWQYSEQWQRQEGIFDPARPAGRPFPSWRQTDGRASPSPIAPDDDEAGDREVEGSGFIPARDKLEAVNRLSRLAGGPEVVLGPGSTEPKSVLVDLARALGVEEVAVKLPKPELGRRLAVELGEEWPDTGWSSGSTITLVGLNILLRGAEARLAGATVRFATALEEAEAIVGVLVEVLPSDFVGLTAIEEMRLADFAHWAQSEWPGFYFEFKGIGPCIGRLGGGPRPTPGKTVFDFAASRTWDFKAHAGDEDVVLLNDKAAIDWALESGGVGFVVLGGRAEHEEAFKDAHTRYKVENGRAPRARTRPRAYERRLKSRFTPTTLDVFWFDGPEDWERAARQDAVVGWKQPQQPGGQARNDKYSLRLGAARKGWQIVQCSLPQPAAGLG